MEPIGSISIYLPFVDEKTRETVLTLMSQSHSYADFVKRICRKVIKEDSEQELVYLASRYASDLWDHNLVKRISDRYGQRYPLIPIWIRDNPKDPDDLRGYAEEVLSTEPEPWIAYHMYSLLYGSARTASIGSPLEERALEEMQQLLASHAELAPLEPSYLWQKADSLAGRGQFEEAVSLLERAIRLLLEDDNRVYLEKVHTKIAYYIRKRNPLKAMEHLETTRNLRKQLGIEPVEYYNLLNIKGLVHLSAGEYDATVESYLKAMDVPGVRGTNIGLRYLPANLAAVYNRMEKHTEALEYARMSLEMKPFLTDSGSYRPFAHFQMAMSLAGLGRISEAVDHLDAAWSFSLKSGSEHMKYLYHLASGLIERAEGNHITAMQSFETALGDGSHPNTLVELTRTEVELFNPTDSNAEDEASGPWMRRLDERVSEGYLPGFFGLALLLKADLRRKQGRHEEMEQLFVQVSELAEDPKVAFLKDLLSQTIRVNL
jgi:tetratricopeptide (TPR) repeat protein